MIIWLVSTAFASTLTLPKDTVPSSEGAALECTLEADALQCSVEGGWVRLVRPGGREELWLDPTWQVDLSEPDVGGDAVSEIQAQREVGAWVAGQYPASIREAKKLASQLRDRVARSGASPGVQERMVDHGLARLASALVERLPPMDLYEDPTFYVRLSAALQLRDEVVEVPAFWSFGWTYGRMAGGVKAQGLDKAIGQLVDRTDGIGRHPSIAGAMAWAIESARTRDEYEALGRGLELWKRLDPPPRIYAQYVEKVGVKQASGPGRPAPELTASDLEGRERRLAELDGPVVIDFWGTWCGPCVAAIPKVKALQEQHGERVTFLALASESASGGPRWKATVKKHGWGEGFEHWMHADPALNRRWSISRWPTYVVLDAEHRVVSFAGNTDEVEQALAALRE